MSYLYYIGIDIGKDFFDVSCLEAQTKALALVRAKDSLHQAEKFSNNLKGFVDFCLAYSEQLAQSFVVLEATGGYETALIAHLLQKGYAVHRADPRAASYFIRSLGKRAKTDRLDALALARYGQERHEELPLAFVQDDAQIMLQSLLARRSDLVAMRAAEQNRLKHPIYNDLQDSVQAVLQTLNAQIDLLHESIAKLISESKIVTTKLKIMTNMKGVGNQTAYSLLGLMPELGTLTRRQAASLAGCAPHPKDSGKTIGYRKTTGGRQAIKRALFMAAMAARNFHPELKLFYENLIKNGKKRHKGQKWLVFLGISEQESDHFLLSFLL